MYIENRVLKEADYIIQNQGTVRSAGKFFKTPKSTVHRDMTKRLKAYSPEKYKKVQEILKKNLEERHIRGGEATRLKYEEQSSGTD